MCQSSFGTSLVIFALLCVTGLRAGNVQSACSYNGNGYCNVNQNTKLIAPEENSTDSYDLEWKIRPQNIGFIYILRTSDDSKDLSIQCIVKWKVQTKNWKATDAAVEGFLITIVDHDTKDVVQNFQVTLTEPFEKFVSKHEILDIRLDIDDLLQFNKRYDAKIAILPFGKQAAASSFISIMPNSRGDQCSNMTALAERWAPQLIVNAIETTSELMLAFKPAPSYLCIKNYEAVVQTRDHVVLNTTIIEVPRGTLLFNISLSSIPRGQEIAVKIRAKNSSNGGCACVNCNCITDKTNYFFIPIDHEVQTSTASPVAVPSIDLGALLLKIFLGLVFVGLLVCALIFGICLLLKKNQSHFHFKQSVQMKVFSNNFFGRSQRCKYHIFLACSNTNDELEAMYIQSLCEALRESEHYVVCETFEECMMKAEQNMLRWIERETSAADTIILIHATNPVGMTSYSILNTFMPTKNKTIVHVYLTPPAEPRIGSSAEYLLPRDEVLFESAYGLKIDVPVVKVTPTEETTVTEEQEVEEVGEEEVEDEEAPITVIVVEEHVEQVTSDSIEVDPKTLTMDSGVSSMTGSSTDSADALSQTLHTEEEIGTKIDEAERHPLLMQIAV